MRRRKDEMKMARTKDKILVVLKNAKKLFIYLIVKHQRRIYTKYLSNDAFRVKSNSLFNLQTTVYNIYNMCISYLRSKYSLSFK